MAARKGHRRLGIPVLEHFSRYCVPSRSAIFLLDFRFLPCDNCSAIFQFRICLVGSAAVHGICGMRAIGPRKHIHPQVPRPEEISSDSAEGL